MEDYIKCALIGGGSPMLLNTLANHIQEIDSIAHEKIIAYISEVEQQWHPKVEVTAD